MTKEIADLSFEEAMGELEILARRLEEGKCPLDEAVRTFERGVSLKNHCDRLLKDARLKVESILIDADGEVKSRPFSPEDSSSVLKNVA